MKVWIDGHVLNGPEARIPVTDHGLLYGDGVFEGIRVVGGRVFRLDDHLARLLRSAKAIGLDVPGGLTAMRRIVLETARTHGAQDAYVRLIVTRGEGELGVDPTTCKEPRILCIVDDVQIYDEEKRARGIDLVTVSRRRPPANVLDPCVKSLNYLNSALAKLEARQRGADEALLLNQQGNVAEASVANVFMVQGTTLRTPPPTDGALAGITRASILEIAPGLGLRPEESSLGRVDLLGADELFLTGTGAGLVPVRTLDREPIGAGAPGPITLQLASALDELRREGGVQL